VRAAHELPAGHRDVVPVLPLVHPGARLPRTAHSHGQTARTAADAGQRAPLSLALRLLPLPLSALLPV
jgi:hypothetical protein